MSIYVENRSNILIRRSNELEKNKLGSGKHHKENILKKILTEENNSDSENIEFIYNFLDAFLKSENPDVLFDENFALVAPYLNRYSYLLLLKSCANNKILYEKVLRASINHKKIITQNKLTLEQKIEFLKMTNLYFSSQDGFKSKKKKHGWLATMEHRKLKEDEYKKIISFNIDLVAANLLFEFDALSSEEVFFNLILGTMNLPTSEEDVESLSKQEISCFRYIEPGHVVMIAVTDNYFYLGNRGGRLQGEDYSFGIKAYKIKSGTNKKDILTMIKNFPETHIVDMLIQRDLIEKEPANILHQKPQSIGNCTVVTMKSLIYTILTIQENKKLGLTGEDECLFNQEAYENYKAATSEMRLNILESFFEVLKNPTDDDKNNETLKAKILEVVSYCLCTQIHTKDSNLYNKLQSVIAEYGISRDNIFNAVITNLKMYLSNNYRTNLNEYSEFKKIRSLFKNSISFFNFGKNQHQKFINDIVASFSKDIIHSLKSSPEAIYKYVMVVSSIDNEELRNKHLESILQDLFNSKKLSDEYVRNNIILIIKNLLCKNYQKFQNMKSIINHIIEVTIETASTSKVIDPAFVLYAMKYCNIQVICASFGHFARHEGFFNTCTQSDELFELLDYFNKNNSKKEFKKLLTVIRKYMPMHIAAYENNQSNKTRCCRFNSLKTI